MAGERESVSGGFLACKRSSLPRRREVAWKIVAATRECVVVRMRVWRAFRALCVIAGGVGWGLRVCQFVSGEVEEFM